MLRKIALFLLVVNTHIATAQEYKSLKQYRKETGNAALAAGCWLTKDREQNTATWQKANTYNLSLPNGHQKYKTISQVRDFYLWFDEERKKQGHEIKWFGVTAIVENQFSKLDSWLVRTFIVPNKEVQNFAHEGSMKVFEYSFPQMANVLVSRELIQGKTAEQWDLEHGTDEQCTVLEPLYGKLSAQGFKKLERIAKRKGLYGLFIPKELEYEGNLADCHVRVEYGLKKLIPLVNQRKK